MAVDGAALREIPPPRNAPRYRDGDGAQIRYFQAPDGRIAGFVSDGNGGWTAVVAPREPAAFGDGPVEAAPDAPLMRVAPGVEAPMAPAEPPPGVPSATAAGERLHWFAAPGGSRLGFVRDGDQWRPAMREPEPTPVRIELPKPALPPMPTTSPAATAATRAPEQDAAAPPWLRVSGQEAAAAGVDGEAPSSPAEAEASAGGGLRGWAKNWWEEAGRNTEAKRARKAAAKAARRGAAPAPAAPAPAALAPAKAVDSDTDTDAAPARNREPAPDEPLALRRLHRRRRWAGRLLVTVAALGVALVLLTLVTDLVNLVHPRTPAVQRIVERGGGGGLTSSELAASSYAVQFTWAYLTYDQANPQRHAAAMAPFLGPDVSDSWNGTGTQEVATAQAMSVTRQSGGMLDVDVAAYVASLPAGGAEQLRWLYLSVPVRVNGTQLTIASLPTAIPPPRAGAPSQGALSPSVSNQDSQLTQQLTGAMKSFFQAWSSGSTTQLAYLETPDAGIQPLGSGQETFVRLSAFQVEAGTGATRTSLALVTWSDPVTGAQFTQPYTVTWENSGSRWLISSVRPGVS